MSASSVILLTGGIWSEFRCLGVNPSRVNNNVDSRCRLLYQTGMAKTPPLGVRLDPDVKAALERAAQADDRSLSALIAKIVAEWVRREGWLKR